MTLCKIGSRVSACVCVAFALTTTLAARGGSPAAFDGGPILARSAVQAKTVPPVSAALLQKLLPSITGWTSGVARADVVEISPESKYSFASVTFTKDNLRVTLRIADTGFNPDCLVALATMVMTMPEDYAGDVAGMTIKRTQLAGSPGVEAWDAQKSAGEVAVVVAGRFVVALEASKLDTLATLRAMLDAVDLKSLAALK